MKLTSLGGADGVTGSKHLIEVAGQRILLDCGLFQGLKLHRERNWQPLPIELKSVDAVVLSAFRQRSMFHATASALNGVPSWNVTP